MTILILAALIGQMSHAPKPRPTPGQILWTFDDGPHRRSTPHILDLLDRYCLRGTWFVLGDQLRNKRHRELLAEIVRRGHTLANHLWSHIDPCKLGPRRTLREWHRTDRRIRALVGGKALLPWYRPPHGSRCNRGPIRRLGQKVVMWDSGDLGWSVRKIRWVIHRRVIRGKRTVTLWHHNWRKFRAVLRLLEKDGHVKRCGQSVDSGTKAVVP